MRESSGTGTCPLADADSPAALSQSNSSVSGETRSVVELFNQNRDTKHTESYIRSSVYSSGDYIVQTSNFDLRLNAQEAARVQRNCWMF